MPSPPSALFHAFLRPPILQILRATGYHSTSPAVLDAMTDLAARYLSLLCERTAEHATHRHGDAGDFSIPDIRLALGDAGALLPEKVLTQQEWEGEEDLRGVEEFMKWFSGQRMKEITDSALGDGEFDEVDYLNALKKRHNKTSDDVKFQGTILGKQGDTGDLEIEGGGDLKSVRDWVRKNGGWVPPEDVPSPVAINGTSEDRDESTPISALGSVGDFIDKSSLAPEPEAVIKLECSAPPKDALEERHKSEPEGTPLKQEEVVKAGDDAMDLT